MNRPGNSPNLAPIEGLQGELERKLASFINEVRNAQASTVQRAKDHLKHTWQRKFFDETLKLKVCRAAYKKLAQRCKMVGGCYHFMDDVYVRPYPQWIINGRICKIGCKNPFSIQQIVERLLCGLY